MILWTALIFFVALCLFILVEKKIRNVRKINPFGYRSYFNFGIALLIIGAIFLRITVMVIAAALIIISLVNKDKWKKEPQGKKIKVAKSQMALLTFLRVILLTTVIVSLTISIILLNI
jgi:hypothetical protein